MPDSLLCLLQYDVAGTGRSRTHEYYQTLMEANAAYCRQVASGCRLWQERRDDTRWPPYWKKVMMTYHALMHGVGGERCSRVLWLDRDAVVTNANATFSFSNTMTIGLESARTCSRRGCNMRFFFNAGVYVIQNSDIGQAIAKEWTLLYDQAESSWRRVNASTGQHWSCSDCTWSGDKYEQGSFARSVLPKWQDDIRTCTTDDTANGTGAKAPVAWTRRTSCRWHYSTWDCDEAARQQVQHFVVGTGGSVREHVMRLWIKQCLRPESGLGLSHQRTMGFN